MENKDRYNPWPQRILFLLSIAYFSFGYMPLNAWNETRGVFHTLALPFENEIPFLAPFILGYSLVYGSIFFIYLIIPDWTIFKKMAWGFFLVTTIHYIVFIFFPVKMIWRPEIVDPQNFFEWACQFIFSLDKPYNCFPSLHVAYPTLAAVLSWRFVPKWRFVFVAMSLIVALSVVLVKQHYILDALGGALVAILVGVFIPQISHLEQKKTPSESPPKKL